MRAIDKKVPRGPRVVRFDAKKDDTCKVHESDEGWREKRQCVEAIKARVKESDNIVYLAERRLIVINKTDRMSVFLHEMFDSEKKEDDMFEPNTFAPKIGGKKKPITGVNATPINMSPLQREV
jgi:hypothetical protein